MGVTGSVMGEGSWSSACETEDGEEETGRLLKIDAVVLGPGMEGIDPQLTEQRARRLWDQWESPAGHKHGEEQGGKRKMWKDRVFFRCSL